jgi:uncharacterized protein YqgC (DUF456 family)
MLTATLLTIGFAILMLPGIALIALGMPGVPYIFVVAALYEIVDRFHHLSGWELLILGVIAIISIVIDQLAGILGGRMGGAKGRSFLYGIAGLIIGNIIFPILGGFIGLFVGVFVGEIIRYRKHEPTADSIFHKSIKAGVGSVLGAAAGMAMNIVLAVVMIALFVIFII